MKPLKEYEVIDYQDDQIKSYHYEDEDGCYYEDLTSFLQCHVLGFCGCGVPNQLLGFIYSLLNLKEEYSNNENVYYTQYNEMRKKYLLENIEMVAWFFDYFLESKNLTMHGGNISGSWVDDHNFMEALKVWYERESGNSP